MWISNDQQSRYLNSLRRHGSVSRAIKAARIPRDLVYRSRRFDPSFARKADDAKQSGLAKLRIGRWLSAANAKAEFGDWFGKVYNLVRYSRDRPHPALGRMIRRRRDRTSPGRHYQYFRPDLKKVAEYRAAVDAVDNADWLTIAQAAIRAAVEEHVIRQWIGNGIHGLRLRASWYIRVARDEQIRRLRCVNCHDLEVIIAVKSQMASILSGRVDPSDHIGAAPGNGHLVPMSGSSGQQAVKAQEGDRPAKSRRGRPTGQSEQVKERDARMKADWNNGKFGVNKAAAARAYGLDPSYARHILPSRD